MSTGSCHCGICVRRKGGEGKGREGKGREGKGREGKGREGKGRAGLLRLKAYAAFYFSC